jgi:predicted phage terminase large subunit-like protein
MAEIPTKKIMGISYGTDVAYGFLRDSREVMNSGWYRQTFPTTILSTAKQTESEFHTTAHGSRYAASVGGPLTGLGADLIIIDDPIKAAEGSMSPAARQAVNDWFGNTLVSRLNDQSSGAIVIVMQRLHLHDLVGQLLEQGDWDHLFLPAEAPTTHHYRIGPKEDDVHTFSAGSLLDPVRYPQKRLEQLRRDMGSKVYSAQILQMPVPDGSTVFDWKWFKFFDNKAPQKPQFDFVFQSWDEAASLRDTADYSVCTTWGVIRTDEFYLLDVRRVKKARSALVELAKQLHDEYAPDIIVVERTGLSDFYRSLAEAIGRRVFPEKPVGDKIFRAEGQTVHVEEGRVFVPREAPWLDEFRREVVAFPDGKHDDQVDSMVQFLRNVPGSLDSR